MISKFLEIKSRKERAAAQEESIKPPIGAEDA